MLAAVSELMAGLGDPGGGDPKPRCTVVLAGYEKEMEEFLEANPGLGRRIVYKFYFKDYTPQELTEIFRKKLQRLHETLEDEKYWHELPNKIRKIPEGFRSKWNGGIADKLYEFACEERSQSLPLKTKVANPEVLTILTDEHLEAALKRLYAVATDPKGQRK